MVLILQYHSIVGIVPVVFCVISFEITLIAVAERGRKIFVQLQCYYFGTCDVIF